MGIAFLGIQTCQGLLCYYDSWKGYNSDIENVCNSVTDLSKTLVLLVESLQKGGMNQERSDHVKTCLTTCEGALMELSDKLQSLRKHKEPDGLRRTTWFEVQKLWYPFRQKNLDRLQGNVAGIQERLKLALQVLQLDTEAESRRLIVGLAERSDELSASVSHISMQNQRILDEHVPDTWQKLNTWLSPADPWVNHDTARQRHEHGTGR